MRKIKIQVHGNTSLDLPMHTVYVLDAQNENLFQLVNNLIYFQRDEIAPILVVGIVSVNRNKEFLYGTLLIIGFIVLRSLYVKKFKNK